MRRMGDKAVATALHPALPFVYTPGVPLMPRVLLIGNYPPDGQESMLRFLRLLGEGLPAENIAVETISPVPLFGRWVDPLQSTLGKWLAYVDKYVVFPWRLRRRVRALPAGAVVHICDHSNAVYVPAAGSAGHRVLVTCHDLGAVRGALGEPTDCPASRTGQVLQRWIVRSLGRADLIACVSSATLEDVRRLVRTPEDGAPPVRLVLNGLNASYQPLDPARAAARLREAGIELSSPFLLNVGSSLRRKNREGILRALASIKDRWPGRVVFAGEALPEELNALADELGITSRVAQIVKPSHGVLEALYNLAFAMIFPSTFEGFGWPVIEAQACGCPVLCSDAGSLPEVVGRSAFVCPAQDTAAFAGECLRLGDSSAARAQWRERGFENVARFTASKMIGRYVELYEALGHSPPHAGVLDGRRTLAGTNSAGSR